MSIEIAFERIHVDLCMLTQSVHIELRQSQLKKSLTRYRSTYDSLSVIAHFRH